MASTGGGSFGWSGLRIPSFNFPAGWQTLWQFLETVKGKWQPNKEEREIVGVVDPLFLWVTDDGIDNSTDDAGNSGLDLAVFDTTSRADSARIEVLNTSGGNETVRGAAIRGKPVLRLSGEQGIIHDAFVDYESIYKNGEIKYELGNNFIVTISQVEKLADFHWKNSRAKRHIYTLSMIGTRYWFSPGEWYTLAIGGAGEQEYISSVVECYGVQIERVFGEMGQTIVAFREVYENWTKDSNALARVIAGGNPYNMPDFGRRLVASSTYMGKADYYCDGTSDEDEINAAISDLVGFGGGFVELTEGTYYTDGAITLADDIVFIGKGWRTIIEKNGNYRGIVLDGSSGNEYNNVYLRDFKITRNASDNNNISLIFFDYVDDLKIENVWGYNSSYRGLEITNCDRCEIIYNKFSDCDNEGIYVLGVSSSSGSRVLGNSCMDGSSFGIVMIGGHGICADNYCAGNGSDGLYLNAFDKSSITGNVCEGNSGNGIGCYSCNNDILSGNIIEGNGDDGIFMENTCGANNVITGNRGTNNTNENFDDDAGSTDSGNDWT